MPPPVAAEGPAAGSEPDSPAHAREAPTVVVGADGCPGNGWVCLVVGPEGLHWEHVVGAEALRGLADELGAVAVAVDVPLGLTEAGPRGCDAEARRFLGGRAASSVFPAPSRVAVACPTYAEARQVQPSLSAQAYALAARIRDADTWLAGDPRCFECHPETSFRLLTAAALERKKTAAGALQRAAALRDALGPLPTDVPGAARLDDALDAAVCAWSALRVVRGEARVFRTGDADPAGRSLQIWG
jgi:predicted RNase H-like nuclease